MLKNPILSIPHLFSPSQISEKETEIGLSRKKGSVTASQAVTDQNQQRYSDFFSLPPPYGIKGVPLDQLIDIDESPWSSQDSNRHYGKSYKGTRVREVGQYSKTTKWTMILGICGDDSIKNVRFAPNSSTTVPIFYYFLKALIENLPKNKSFIFLWDNLNVHMNEHIYNLVTSNGHRIIPRPPYTPEAGPIEFIFNQIETKLQQQQYHFDNDDEYLTAIFNALHEIRGIQQSFLHCGYGQ